MLKVEEWKTVWRTHKKKQVFFRCIQHFLIHSNITRLLKDETYLKMRYYALLGKKLDLYSPKTFNEKLQWLKLYERNPLYTTLVDKYEVKKYIAEKIGEQYIIPTLGVWESFNEIEFDKLPNQFVLKCTHDSGGVVIIKNKRSFDGVAAKKKIERCLKHNYYYYGREWPYKNVKPRIIAESYLEDLKYNELRDFKFMCFNGKVRCTFVCSERFSKNGLKVTFFDEKWNIMPFERHYPRSDYPIEKPKNYEKMIELAEKLSKGISFVRVDFYEVEEKIYFGEMTLYPGSGMEEFTPERWDYELGKWLSLPCENRE